jgi:hypothetical protein
MVEGLDTRFCDDHDVARAALASSFPDLAPDDRTISQLLLDYFEWLVWLLTNAKDW